MQQGCFISLPKTTHKLPICDKNISEIALSTMINNWKDIDSFSRNEQLIWEAKGSFDIADNKTTK